MSGETEVLGPEVDALTRSAPAIFSWPRIGRLRSVEASKTIVVPVAIFIVTLLDSNVLGFIELSPPDR
jgi:hypothetical protein